MAKILVTGASGYLGCALVEELLLESHSVIAVDWLVHGRIPLGVFIDNPGFKLVQADVRVLDPAQLVGVDAVCDLAALAGPESCRLHPELARSINVTARKRLMLLAKARGARRYILATNQPRRYGGLEDDLDREAEDGLLYLSELDFCTTVLRFGEYYGLSRRMRFDQAR